MMSKFMVATVAALALTVGFTSLANATEYKREYCHETKAYWQFEKVVTYKTITDYKYERQEFVKWVIEYDHWHKPHKVKKVFHKTIKVPVHKQIPIVHWVKVKRAYDY